MTRTPRLVSIIVLIAAVIVIPAVPAFAPCHIITFEGDPYTVGEGAGSVTITVSKNGNGGNPTVEYETVNDSAKAGSDYQSKSGTLTIDQEEVEFTVPIINDKAFEKSERFMVGLSNAEQGGCQFSVSVQEDTAVVTIQDNDKLITLPTQSASPTPTPTRTATKSPKPKPSTASATPSPSPTATSPSPSVSGSPIAAAADDGGGLSGGAVGGIVAATLVLGTAAAFWVRRRFLA